MKRISATPVIMMIAVVPAIVTSACSDPEQPRNIEPEIILSPASSITRTEAVLSAEVVEKGGPVSRFSFRYGPTEAMEMQSPEITLTDGLAKYQLSNLIPATTYHFMAEAGDGYAVVRSLPMSFTTMPYEIPTLSATSILSSGPAGILVGFSVDSDGGTPVVSSGCDLLNLSSGEKQRVVIDSPVAVGSPQRVYVSVGSRESSYSITPFASNSTGEAYGTSVAFTPESSITIDEPGTLSLMEESVDFSSGGIVISGKMNGDDFRFLRLLLGAEPLQGETAPAQTISKTDLSDVSILEGGASYDGSRFTVANTVTTGLFSGCSSLTDLILPSTATTIQSDAFSGSERLKSILLPALLSDFSPSADCPELEDITIAEGNGSFRSREGVLFNASMNVILWFPAGKTGDYTIPESVATVGENTFRDSRLSSLSFPPGLTAIGRGALAGSLMEEVSLPDGLENVPEALCQNSARLSTVRLGSASLRIGAFAFAGCPLTDLYIYSPYPPVAADNAFGSEPSAIFGGCVLHVVQGTAPIYRNHAVWGKFSSIIADIQP